MQVRRELPHRQHRGDALALLQRQQVDQRPAARGAPGARQAVHLQPVNLAGAGKAQQRVVGVGDEQRVHKVFLAHRGGGLALAAAALQAVFVRALRLGVTGVGNRDDDFLLADEVFVGHLDRLVGNLGAALVGVGLAHLGQFLADDLHQAVRLGQNLNQVVDGLDDAFIIGDDLVLLQRGQAVQAQIKYRLRLFVGQAVALAHQAEGVGQAFRARCVGVGALKHVRDDAGFPDALHQRGLGLRRRLRRLDQRDDLVNVGQRDGLPFQQVRLLARLSQVKHRAPRDDLAAVADERLEHFLQVEQFRLAVVERDHVDAEGGLHRRVAEQVVQHDVAGLAALEFNDDAHAVLVGLVAQRGDALDALFLDQFGDFLEQARLVDHVRQFGNDDGLAVGLVVAVNAAARAHDDAPAPGVVGLDDAVAALDDGRGREVRPRQVLDQAVNGDFGVVNQRERRADDFGQVVRRDVGRHADGDAGGAVDQQVRHPRRQHQRFFFGVVVVGDEVHRFLVEVGEQFVGDLRHAHLGVAHGRRRVAVHRAEVALPVHQHVAQRKRLRHADDGVVHRDIAVRVVFADDITDDARGLLVGLVPVVAEFAHRVQHAPVHRLEAVAHIRQGAPDDDAHRIVQIGLAHLVFKIDGQDFLRVGVGISHSAMLV